MYFWPSRVEKGIENLIFLFQFVKERPSIYDAMTSSRNSFAAVRLTGKATTASHPHKRTPRIFLTFTARLNLMCTQL